MRLSRAVLAMAPVIGACGSAARAPGAGVTASAATAQASAETARSASARASDCTRVTVMRGGVEQDTVCAVDALARGLTIVDLTDGWTPALFAPAADGQVPSFHDRYLALAAERDENGRAIEGEDALDELYGVVPALAIVRARLADDPRHACHAAIDPKPVLALDRTFSQDDKQAVALMDAGRIAFAARIDRERTRRKLDTAAVLATDPQWKDVYARWQKLDAQHTALVAAEQEFRCEGWLVDKDTDGSFTWRTGNAIEQFQRRNFLLPTERLDPETRAALQIDSREQDYRLALRVLRERVVDATGLLEDGSAQRGPLPILGRQLDPDAMRMARGQIEPAANGAPDLISPATERAAVELGWLGPAEVRAFLARHPDGVRVALALPPAPAYYAPHMALAAEIDRGDVFYDETPPPFRRIVAHRPTLTLYATDAAGARRALVRWPTTIGGWADQRLPDGSLVQRWKESEVGKRVWRDLFAGPTWLAPKTTPDRELVKNLWNGHWALKTEELGPGPHSAYGMILLEHLQAIKLKDGSERLDDNGIGTHGSASVTSIVNGTSHGCHRLYNQLAVRLGDFLLRHRDHVVRGEQAEQYRRWVRHNDELFKAKLDTRGFLYELTPPVEVTVLPGNILSQRKVPPNAAAPARP